MKVEEVVITPGGVEREREMVSGTQSWSSNERSRSRKKTTHDDCVDNVSLSRLLRPAAGATGTTHSLGGVRTQPLGGARSCDGKLDRHQRVAKA